MPVLYKEHDIRKVYNGTPLVDWHHYLEDVDENKQFELRITHLVHYTENKSAEAIGASDSFLFQPTAWNDRGGREFRYLSWWSLIPPTNWSELLDIENHPNFQKNSYDQYYGKSPIFNDKSLYGPIGFAVSWKDILDQYAISRGKVRADIQLKCIGTIKYTREVMYAILVCVQGDQIKYKDTSSGQIEYNNTEEFPLIENETEAFRGTVAGEDFIWKFYSTTAGYSPFGKPPAHTWDHLSFAFYFPGEDRLIIPPNFCEIKTKVAIVSIPESRNAAQWRRASQKADEEVVNQLKEKINLELEKTKSELEKTKSDLEKTNSDLEKVTSDLEKFNFEKK